MANIEQLELTAHRDPLAADVKRFAALGMPQTGAARRTWRRGGLTPFRWPTPRPDVH